jgi:hypothetical protein
MRGMPELGQQVFVIAPDGAAIDALVHDVAEGATMLSLAEPSHGGLAALEGGPVAIQYTNRRGVCRIDGVAHEAGQRGVLRVDHTGTIELIQRREFVRVDAICRATYRPFGGDSRTLETTTLNVSGGGFMVSGREGLREGDLVPFTLFLDGDVREAGPLEIEGRVSRETRPGLGISIEGIEDEERERLIRWVFARERLSRQIVRGT